MFGGSNLITPGERIKHHRAEIVTGKEGELEVLTPEEEKLFIKLRHMPEGQRTALLAMIESLTKD